MTSRIQTDGFQGGEGYAVEWNAADEDAATPVKSITNDNDNRKEARSKDLEANAQSEEWKPTRKEWLIIITLTITQFVVPLDATIIVTVLPTIAQDLHGSANDAFWTGTSYLLTHAALQPFIATLSNIFGRKELLFPIVIFFLVGSVVCAVAHNFTTMFVGRVIQGVGGAGIIALNQVIMSDVVPLRQRPKYFSVIQLAWVVGTVAGPVIGAAFIQVTWRWIFWINVPFCAISAVMILLFMNLKTEKTSLRSKVMRMDWTGSILFTGGVTSVLLAITWGGTQFPWHSVQTVAPLVIGLVAIFACLFWERYYATEAFLIKAVFIRLSAIVCYVGALFQGLTLFSVLYYVPFYFTAVKFESPVGSAVALLPVAVFVLPGTVVVANLITRFGTYRWAVWSGWAIAAVGSGMLIRLDANTSKAYWASAETVFGIGAGMVTASIQFSLQAVLNPEDAGSGAVMYAFIRSLGMALGVAIGGTVFENILQIKLVDSNVPSAREIARSAESYVATLRTLSPTDPLRNVILNGYTKGIQGAFIVLTGACAIALFFSLFLKHENMNKTLVTKYSAR